MVALKLNEKANAEIPKLERPGDMPLELSRNAELGMKQFLVRASQYSTDFRQFAQLVINISFGRYDELEGASRISATTYARHSKGAQIRPQQIALPVVVLLASEGMCACRG